MKLFSYGSVSNQWVVKQEITFQNRVRIQLSQDNKNKQ